MRVREPKAFTSSGISAPSTRSKSSATFSAAGPLETRSAISVISRSAETGVEMRRSWACVSRCATKAGRASFQHARFAISGSIDYEDRSYPGLSFAYYPPDAPYAEMRATADTELLVAQWATLHGPAPELCNL